MFPNIFKEIQLCCGDEHDKEAALIKFTSDPLYADDLGESSSLIPLNLSSSSNTEEHAALIDRLDSGWRH